MNVLQRLCHRRRAHHFDLAGALAQSADSRSHALEAQRILNELEPTIRRIAEYYEIPFEGSES